MCRGCVRVTVLKLSVRLGVGGRPGSVIVWAGDPDFGVASAANLYETVASDDRVVAGRFPGSKNEKRKSVRFVRRENTRSRNEYPGM